jgi:hypothetical protein
MPGHAILGAQYTATSMIGMIALAGIIVRNSILLVDFIVEARRGGLSLDRAISQAGHERVRPIVMTTLAMVGGMLPAMLVCYIIAVMTISSRYVRGTVFLGLVSTLSAAEVMLRIALQVEVERDLAMSHAPTLVSVSGFFKDAYEDAKGMRRILYFPRLEITEGELREVEEEFAHSSTHRSDS